MTLLRPSPVSTLSLTALILSLAWAPPALACAGCGCTLSSDWESQGFSTTSGWKVDLRYDYLNQDQLRHNRSKINPSQVPDGQELETYSHNRYWTLGLDYSPDPDWGVNVQLPQIDREHGTLGEDHASPDHSSHNDLGDIRVLGRYQGWLPGHNLGLQFGLKLPTGSHTQTFDSGAALDRGLQPGSGTTDLLLGAYFFDALSQNWDYFAQALAQTPLDTKDQYRPGKSLNFNVGVRYMNGGNWVPQVQINARVAGKDQGAQADQDNSGGRLVYLSPGVTYKINAQTSVYGFVQVPLFQDVNGYQLTPKTTDSLGVRYAF